jgi:hypothetical protein
MKGKSYTLTYSSPRIQVVDLTAQVTPTAYRFVPVRPQPSERTPSERTLVA